MRWDHITAIKTSSISFFLVYAHRYYFLLGLKKVKNNENTWDTHSVYKYIGVHKLNMYLFVFLILISIYLLCCGIPSSFYLVFDMNEWDSESFVFTFETYNDCVMLFDFVYIFWLFDLSSNDLSPNWLDFLFYANRHLSHYNNSFQSLNFFCLKSAHLIFFLSPELWD